MKRQIGESSSPEMSENKRFTLSQSEKDKDVEVRDTIEQSSKMVQSIFLIVP